MHAAIGLTMGMYLFDLVMIVLNLAAFGAGIRGPFARKPASGMRHRVVSSEQQLSPLCGGTQQPAASSFLPDRCAKTEASTKSAKSAVS